MVPIQYTLLFRFFQLIGNPNWNSIERIGLICSMGISCGVLGINVAHELGHRRSKLDRVLARLLLMTSLNWQFYIEHNRGHHINVSTPGDPESALRGESIYHFWLRAIRDAYWSAWKIDFSEMALGMAVEGLLILLVFHFFGMTAVMGFLASALFGILLLQSVNYIEHYGLSRSLRKDGRFEPVAPGHSWNANHLLSRAVLFELSRHSDHHANSLRKYPLLKHHAEAPQMPTGYPGMILLALLPPIWFRVMDPRIQLESGSN
jgi:alkane 1-monooxygenase